jgi:serine/threonine protein kinase/Tfp pilus assembly protein PilF
MKCPKCKADNPDDSRFCNKCGTSLIDIPTTPTGVPTETGISSEKSALDFSPGQHFGKRYQIIEEIGRGGMGRVYKAVDKELNKVVALKMIKPELSDTAAMVQRFKKELVLAREVTHKNVCRIHDLGEVKGIRFISMQYIEGQDLKKLMQQTGKLTVEKVIAITKQICEALQAAHDEGVIHRDLKPQNIMLDSKGNAYVMDFGIARSLESEEVTKPGMVIGTPHFMSPEQAEGKEADVRSDIYALGCILYEMTTGKPPFKADTSVAMIHKHMTETPKPPSQFNPQIPKALEEIILKCLQKKSEKRYQKVDDIIKAIDDVKPDLISAAKPAKMSWKKIIPIAAIILIMIGIGFYYIMRKEKAAVSPAQAEWKNSIAVLPFANLSSQEEQEYFCEGLAEALINALTNIKGLRVVARTSAFSFKGRDVDVREIGKKLNVQTVLEGSVQQAGNRLRISAQLINVEDGYHLWSERYDRETTDVFAIQDDISQAIVTALKIKLGVEEKAALVKRYTNDIEAYNLYLKGRYYWNKRTAEGMNRSIEYFKQTIEINPTYALAYTGLAEAYIVLGEWSIYPPKEVFPKARTAALKALEIDDELAEAHSALAMIKRDYDWDWSGAEREFKRAIELNPNYPTAHQWYAEYLTGLGRDKEAIVEAKRAQELDPLSLIINTAAGDAFHYAGQYDRAIEQYQKALDLDATFAVAHLFLGWIYRQKGMYEEAIAEIQTAINLHGEYSPFAASLAHVYALAGKIKEAREILDNLKKQEKQIYVSPFYIAIIYSALDEKNQAFEWLEKAFDEKDCPIIYIKVEFMLDPLRSDPRFKALLKKMNLE